MESIVEERSGRWPTERSETADRVQLTNELTASTVATGLTVERVTDCNTPYGSNLDNSLYLQSLSVVLFYTHLLSFPLFSSLLLPLLPLLTKSTLTGLLSKLSFTK